MIKRRVPLFGSGGIKCLVDLFDGSTVQDVWQIGGIICLSDLFDRSTVVQYVWQIGGGTICL